MGAVLDKIIFDAEVSARKIIIVPIETLRHTPYNPVGRTKEGKKLTRLVETVVKYGQIYPILITEDRDVVDGNRRLAACRLAGLSKVECIVSPLDRDETFNIVNTTAEKIAGKGWLEIGRGGGKLPATEGAQYRELHSLVGNYGVDLLIQKGLGLNILGLCKQVCSFGTAMRLEEVIMAAAQGRLTNRLNMEVRSRKTTDEKRRAMDELLAAAGAT